jgi:hypothetical protein
MSKKFLMKVKINILKFLAVDHNGILFVVLCAAVSYSFVGVL